MKLKLSLVFIGIVVILLMAGLEIVQGEDGCYTAEAGYPVCATNDCFYVAETGYPVYYECSENYYFDTGYPMDVGYPVEEVINNPVIPDSSIESSSNPLQLDPIEPQYRNGRNLWQEIVFQFSRLLELMK